MNVINTVVFHEDGKFAGWPANNGCWSWGDEILVSYVIGTFVPSETKHSIDFDGKMLAGLARSLDGGMTWSHDILPEIYDDPCKNVPVGGFDFSAPGFVLRVGRPEVGIHGHVYLISCDKGKTWDGPFALPDFGFRLSCRTAYIVDGPKTMTIFLSKLTESDEAYHDRSFAAKTVDGGQTWEFVGNMAEDYPRNVMPAVVKTSDGTIVAALRRRVPFEVDTKNPATLSFTDQDNWIETRTSKDGGKTWENINRTGETGTNNGNPPALCLLPDGRVVLAFGRRGPKSENNLMAVKVSSDGGKTFGDEIVVRNDARTFDMGYPRLVALPDGRAVMIYYYNSTEFTENYIAASIFKI